MMSGEENNRINIDTEDLKNQTKDTVNQVRDTIKDVNFKEDSKEATGFVKEMLNNPFETVTRVAREEENTLKKSILMMIVFLVASVLYEIIDLIKYGSYLSIGDKIMGLLASALHPILFILVPAIIILVMNKNNKKSLPVIISTLVAASIPVILVEVIDILEILVSAIRLVTSPISTGLTAVATVLTFFGMKELFSEEDTGKFIKTFIIIKVIAAFVFYLLSSAGIY